MEILVHFKHKSVKDYCSGKRYQHNKFLIDVEYEDDIEIKAEFKIMDMMEIMYPTGDGSGYDTLYKYEITKIVRNPQ